MGWIIIININFKIVEESSQSVTLQTALPPSSLKKQKEQEGAGS